MLDKANRWQCERLDFWWKEKHNSSYQDNCITDAWWEESQTWRLSAGVDVIHQYTRGFWKPHYCRNSVWLTWPDSSSKAEENDTIARSSVWVEDTVLKKYQELLNLTLDLIICMLLQTYDAISKIIELRRGKCDVYGGLHGHRRNTNNKRILWMPGKAARGMLTCILNMPNEE